MANKPLDPLEVLRGARDATQKFQELVTKVTLPADQRKALAEGLSRLVMPGEQLQAMIDLADAFGPPQTQIAEIQKTLAAQRTDLEAMLADLDKIEASVERLAAATEQIVALQAPMRALLLRNRSETEDPDAEAD